MRAFVILLSTLAVALSQTCGKTPINPDTTNVNNKIVGGDTAVPYSWPWQVSLCDISTNVCDFECGGSIIGRQWIMTAGHCVYDRIANWVVKAGVFNQTRSDEPGEVVLGLKNIRLHPQYNHDPKRNDIALLELINPLPPFNQHIQPVCLPKTDQAALSEPKAVWTTGWGDTWEGQNHAADLLRQVNVPIVNITTCQNQYPGKIWPAEQFCAGKQGVDACQGDSGGPAVARKTKTSAWYQYGVVSWGFGCARKEYSGVYTRVSAYCNWINTTTNAAVQCKNVV